MVSILVEEYLEGNGRNVLKVLSRPLLLVTEEIHENLSYDCGQPGRDSNLLLFKLETRFAKFGFLIMVLMKIKVLWDETHCHK
jgi:hypothetical protein